jgi:branched-chain amino acid transport system permease protein
VTIYTAWRLVHSPFGRAMLAQREDLIAARAAGVSILRARLLAFALSAFFTGVAGALFVHFIVAFSPATFDFTLTFSLIAMLVVGGLGSIGGSVVGVVLITVLSEVLRNLESGVRLGSVALPPLYGLSQIVLAALFVVIIIFRPRGLLGAGAMASQPSLRGLALRRSKGGVSPAIVADESEQEPGSRPQMPIPKED